MNITPYEVARHFIGVRETPGIASTPLVLAMLELDNAWPTDDATPWCAAFVNFVAFLLGLPRSRSLAARSWLPIGTPVDLTDARQDADVVVLERGAGGHVGFFAGRDQASGEVFLLGGNQGDAVSVAPFAVARVLGVRRLVT